MIIQSSSKRAIRVLAGPSASESKDLLLELANLQNDLDAGRRFVSKFGVTVPGTFGPLNRADWGEGPEADKAIQGMYQGMIDTLVRLRDALRNVWTAEDLDLRRYGVLQILRRKVQPVDPEEWPFSDGGSSEHVSRKQVTRFERILEYLLRSDVQFGVCANHECSAPYFFPRRRSQKYCSDPCARPSRNEAKRSWWATHGDAWRKARKRKRVRRKRKL
jgi:hypothetical protein